MSEWRFRGSRAGWRTNVVAGRLIAPIVGLAAGILAGLEVRPLASLFLRAGPTPEGLFGLQTARPLLMVAAHLALILVAVHQMFAVQATVLATRGVVVFCYAVLALEWLTLAPCLFAGDALCGVYYVGFGPGAAIAIAIGFVAYLTVAKSRAFLATAMVFLLLGASGALAAYWRLTPKSYADCDRVSEPIGRDHCRMGFALEAGDEILCDRVDFDSLRWSCLYQIAEREGNVALCDRITLPCRNQTPGPVCDPDFYRDTCLLVVARKLRDPHPCERIIGGELRERCSAQAR